MKSDLVHCCDQGALPQFGDWEDTAIDGGGVGYTGIFQAKRNNRANGAPGGVMPPLQQEPLPPVVISKKTPTKNLLESMVSISTQPTTTRIWKPICVKVCFLIEMLCVH